MKKYTSFFFIVPFLCFPVHIQAQQSVIVSAVVWNINQAPLVLNVIPNSNPRFLARNKTQSYTLYFRDNEKDIIYYTITPVNGYTNPISWVINIWDYDGNNWAYINFLYLAPALATTNEKVIVTLNDWPNVVVKELSLYIY